LSSDGAKTDGRPSSCARNNFLDRDPPKQLLVHDGEESTLVIRHLRRPVVIVRKPKDAIMIVLEIIREQETASHNNKCRPAHHLDSRQQSRFCFCLSPFLFHSHAFLKYVIASSVTRIKSGLLIDILKAPQLPFGISTL